MEENRHFCRVHEQNADLALRTAPLERSSRTIRAWFRSDYDLLEHRKHEYSRFIVRLELEVIYSNKTNTTIYTNMA